MQYAGLDRQREPAAAYKQLLFTPQEVTVTSSMLGSGQFGYVWRGTLSRRRMQGRTVALKVMKVSLAAAAAAAASSEAQAAGASDERRALQERSLVQILLEARVHASLRHENLVELLGVQDKVQPVMLALELCEGGDLRQHLRQRVAGGESSLNSIQRCDMAQQVARGLGYLHRNLCLHRDMAARNVLLTAQPPPGRSLPACGFLLKLGDLGLTRTLRAESDYYRVRCGEGGRGGGVGDFFADMPAVRLCM